MTARDITTWIATVRLGWQGRLGLGLLVLAAAAYFLAVAPAAERLDELEHSAHAQASRAGSPALGGARPADEQLVEFYRFFPGDKEFVDWLGKVALIANEDGLAIDQAEYTVVEDVGGRLARYQVTLPIRGDYRQIRRFLSTLGSEVPIVALEQVQFDRQKVGDTVVNARIRLAIFMAVTT